MTAVRALGWVLLLVILVPACIVVGAGYITARFALAIAGPAKHYALLAALAAFCGLALVLPLVVAGLALSPLVVVWLLIAEVWQGDE